MAAKHRQEDADKPKHGGGKGGTMKSSGSWDGGKGRKDDAITKDIIKDEEKGKK